MKTVIEMALDTGFDADDETTLTSLERFADLVAADENEACAVLLEENAQECSGPMGLVLQANADAIRERIKS